MSLFSPKSQICVEFSFIINKIVISPFFRPLVYHLYRFPNIKISWILRILSTCWWHIILVHAGFDNFFFFFFFVFGHVACRISVPWPGIEPMPPALEAHSISHWTAREVLSTCWIWFDNIARAAELSTDSWRLHTCHLSHFTGQNCSHGHTEHQESRNSRTRYFWTIWKTAIWDLTIYHPY